MIRALLFALCLAPLAYAENTLPPINEKACVGVGTSGGMGSGTIVGKTGDTFYVLTAAHVVKDPGRSDIYVIQRHTRKPKTGKVVKIDTVVDIALVEVNGLDGEPIPIAKNNIELGEYVAHYGKATGPQEGKVASFANYVPAGKTANTDYFSTPGDSGAGVFNKAGELVGVHYARTAHPGVAYEDQKGLVARLDHVRTMTNGYVK